MDCCVGCQLRKQALLCPGLFPQVLHRQYTFFSLACVKLDPRRMSEGVHSCCLAQVDCCVGCQLCQQTLLWPSLLTQVLRGKELNSDSNTNSENTDMSGTEPSLDIVAQLFARFA